MVLSALTLVLASSQFVPVSTAAAERLAAAYIAGQGEAGRNWASHPRLKEITTREIQDRLHAQVFKYDGFTGNVSEPEAYLVRDRHAYPMSVGFGGSGIGDMAVEDLDGDGTPELIYTYSWGSGMHRSHLAAMLFDGLKPSKIETSFVVRNDDVALRLAGHALHAFLASDKGGTADLGRFSLDRAKGDVALVLHFPANLPKSAKDLIWTTVRSRPSG